MVAVPKPALPMRVVSGRRATADDLRALGEDARYEIIGGALVAMPPPTAKHGNATFGFGGLLGGPFQHGRGGPGGWSFSADGDIEFFPDEICRPDVAGWRRERVPTLPDGWPTVIRPDWVCEVLSPSNSLNDLGVKLATYHRAGVPHYWTVEPREQTLTVHRWTATGYEVTLEAKRDDVVRAEPFEAIEFVLADLFA